MFKESIELSGMVCKKGMGSTGGCGTPCVFFMDNGTLRICYHFRGVAK